MSQPATNHFPLFGDAWSESNCFGYPPPPQFNELDRRRDARLACTADLSRTSYTPGVFPSATDRLTAGDSNPGALRTAILDFYTSAQQNNVWKLGATSLRHLGVCIALPRYDIPFSERHTDSAGRTNVTTRSQTP